MSKASKMPPQAGGRPNNFQTLDPERALRGLINHIPMSKKIWCCSSGAGRMVEYLKEVGYSVIGTDILNGFDFLDPLSEIPECDVILENPPYDVKDKWLARCYQIGKPFALLLPVYSLGEQKRTSMYRENGIEVFLPDHRIEFITPNRTEGGGWFFAAWFCHGILPELICYAGKEYAAGPLARGVV